MKHKGAKPFSNLFTMFITFSAILDIVFYRKMLEAGLQIVKHEI